MEVRNGGEENDEAQIDDQQAAEDSEGDEIDRLMLTAQGHDTGDENRRVHASQYRPVSTYPASRVLFAVAKPKGASIVFAED